MSETRDTTKGGLEAHLVRLAIPLGILAVAVAANLLLDLLFVVRFGWGIAGAAAATAFSQSIAAVCCVLYLIKSHRELLFGLKDCQFGEGQLQRTAHFGVVAAMHQSGLYIGKMLVQGAVNTAGTSAIVAYTAATRIEGFANSFGDSGAAATSIVTAQNSGAGKRERVRRTFFASFKLLVILGIASSLILFFTAPQTMQIMLGSAKGQAFSEAVSYMRIVAVFYLFCFTGNTFAGFYDGIGQVQIPFVGAISHILLRVVLSWLFVAKFGLNAVAVATGIGWVLVNVFWTVLLRKGKFLQGIKFPQ